MLGDLFKIFVEEPQKLTKVGIRVIKTLFFLIIAEWLYRQFFGKYTLMKLSEYKEWANFILSGRLIIVVACYLIVQYIIEPIFSLLVYLIVVRGLANWKFLRIEREEINLYMKAFDIVKIEKGSKIPKPGNNIDILYNIVNDFKDAQEIQGYKELKNSLLNDIINLYALFLVVYFIFIDVVYYNNYFGWLIIIAFTGCIILYIRVNSIIEYLQKNYQELLTGLDVIKDYNLVNDLLAKHFIKPYRNQLRIGKEEFFEYAGKSYALAFDFGNRLTNKEKLAKYIKKIESLGKHLFIITKAKYNSNNLPAISNSGQSYTLISYEDYNDLKGQLESKMISKIKGE